MPCADCFKGHDHPGPYEGEIETLHGLDVYVAKPRLTQSERKSVIVVLSDMFGWDTTNLRRLSDICAERTGCVVYVPDFMHGTSAPASMKPVLDQIANEGGLWGWMRKPWLILKIVWTIVPFMMRNSPEKRFPGVLQFIDKLRCSQERESKLGVVGFCWGGYGVTQLAHGGLARNGRTLIDAAYTAHPSELKVPEHIVGIKLPYSMIVGDVDFALSLNDAKQSAEILEKNADVPSEIVIIPGAKHGFAVRYDPDNKAEIEMADQAEDQMVRWFAHHLN
ncbi:Alpha/Beta hydrolase protein [Plectosphaerella cucumerina]|uniref:Alpha/Beta hydrolase protein n=1 Tax=Plectosphaerella cucumerina TaxID=40658 RepID=A0A8K0TU90_9PEZI|nr:Alpha/Beta hydrolase protein [Plectosphaerella cucumerina]